MAWLGRTTARKKSTVLPTQRWYHDSTSIRACEPAGHVLPAKGLRRTGALFPRGWDRTCPPPPFFSSKRPYLESVCPVPSFVDRQISGEPLFQASSTLIPTPRLRPSARPVPPRPPGRPSQVVAGYDQLLLAKIRGRFRRNTNGNSFSPSKQHHHLAQCFPSLSTSLRQCGLPFSVYTFS